MLLISNAVPLVGVLLLHWQVFPLVLLYWLENIVVGGFNVLRLLVADPESTWRWVGKLIVIPIFCIHFGLFTMIHGVFVFAHNAERRRFAPQPVASLTPNT